MARGVLAARCVRCHGPDRQDGGLRLDSRPALLRGGDSGPGLLPGDPGRSELQRRVEAGDPRRRMPFGAPALPAAEIAVLRAWIAGGAPEWPAAGSDGPGRGHAEREPGGWRRHWAFRPVRRPSVPRVRAQSRVRTPVDAFVLARLEAQGLSLAAEAPAHTLTRRLYLDLLGLPPPADPADTAVPYEALVDRLLASPHFGERWGRHWLDLARFAESDGYENDRLRRDAWRFRDWVVDAVQRDLPFDQFTIEQLAGDLLPGATPAQRVAAGFHRHTLWNSAASADKEEFRTYAVKDRTDTTGLTWMGLTVGCAKCHTHKYDPITQREYYQLYAFFNATEDDEVRLADGKAPTLRAVDRPTRVLLRGNFLQPGDPAPPGTPAFLPALEPRGPTADRLDLARWLVRPDHPLTSRVTVNQFWMHLFGAGLAPTPENFGISGQPPTHPELLDWLSAEFMSRKWSRKALLRQILLSSTYRQASARRPELDAVDPDNVLLGRQNRVRADAEVVHDLALSAAGILDPKLGGPSGVPPFPDGLLEQRFTNEDLKLPQGKWARRALYIHVQRTLQHPLLAAFDAPDGNQPCARRDRSATPIQALTLLNDPTYAACARALGERIRQAAPETEARLRFGFRLCLGRDPDSRETGVLGELVAAQQRAGGAEPAVWAGVARTLLNLDEFITRE